MDPISLVRARLALAQWLGPWADAEGAPRATRRHELDDGDALQARYYLPASGRPVGSMLLAHGMHFLGPLDPRIDRFCRILANAGFAVLAPHLPSFMALQPRPTVISRFAHALRLLQRQPEVPARRRPGVFSISFGSLPALRLAADPDTAHEIGGLVIFGGYADWEATTRYILDGAVAGYDGAVVQRNPLNRPVAYMNLLSAMPEAPDDPAPLLEAWRTFVRRTWPHHEMKEPENNRPILDEIVETLPPAQRALFTYGCCRGGEVGLQPGLAALAQRAPERAFLDPKPHLPGVRCPVTLVHGVDDDVIHHSQLDALAAGLTGAASVRKLRTGLYSHSATGSPSPNELLRELTGMIEILGGIVSSATDTHRGPVYLIRQRRWRPRAPTAPRQ